MKKDPAQHLAIFRGDSSYAVCLHIIAFKTEVQIKTL